MTKKLKNNSLYTLGDNMNKKSYIAKEKNKYCVKSRNNPDWSGGCYNTKAESEKRLAQVEAIKHAKKADDGKDNKDLTSIIKYLEEAGLVKDAKQLKNIEYLLDSKSDNDEFYMHDDLELEASVLNNNIKTLSSLSQDLNQMGFYNEADIVDTLINKVADKGVPPYHYELLEHCIENGLSLEECNEFLNTTNKKHNLSLPSITEENYQEMKKTIKPKE